MRLFLGVVMALASTGVSAAQQTGPSAQQAKPFTLQQILSAPYALSLTAAPTGSQFAWIEHAEGARNIWVGGAKQPSRSITHYTEDDGQDINGLTWSPDASAIAYALGAEAGANGKPANPAHVQRPTAVEVWVQPVAAGAPAIDLGEGHAPLFTHDGHSVLFLRSGQIWIADLPTSKRADQPKPHQLVYDNGGSAGSLTLSHSGTLLAFISHRKLHSLLGIYNLTTKSLDFLAPSTGNDTAPVFSSDDQQIAWLRNSFTFVGEFETNRVSAYPWSILLATVNPVTPAGTWPAHTVYTPKPNLPGSVPAHLATGESHLYFTPGHKLVFFSEADGYTHLYELDSTSTVAPKLLTPGKFEVEDAAQGPDGTLFYASNQQVCAPAGYTTNNFPIGGALACDNLDTDRRHLWKLGPKGPEAVTTGEGIETKPQIAPDGTIAALISNTHIPMHPVLVAADGTTTELHPNAVPESFPNAALDLLAPHQVLFPSDSTPAGVARSKSAPDDIRSTLHGQVFLPAYSQATVHPALIFLHGGPRRQMLLGYPAMEYYSNAFAMNQYLASRGFLVLSVNYRCGIGYGMDFRQCIHEGADGAAEYNDVLAAVRYLRTRKDVDSKRIGLWGGSYGGNLTAMGLARNSDLFAAGVDYHGVHDWILEDNNADWLVGSNAEKDAIAIKAHASSPMSSVDKWKSPVLLIHGDVDPTVAYAQTPALADQLQARNVHVEELILPDEVHEFLLYKDWLKAYTAEDEFFERILKP
jgi:dipeptidyl aminopeptidase/acylaminoacyl peptidase